MRVNCLFLDMAIKGPTQALGRSLPYAQDARLPSFYNGERPEREGAVRVRGSFLTAHNLAVVIEGIGDSEKTKRYQSLSKQLREAAR